MTHQDSFLTATTAMIDAARKAGERIIRPGFRTPQLATADTKSGTFDLVTACDQEAEEAIRADLLHHFPFALVTGEERIAAFPQEREQMVQAHEAFLIDPIDGTLNFAQGVGAVATIIAHLQRGVPVAGVLHDPIAGDTVVGETGRGAWFIAADGSKRRLGPTPHHPAQAVMANTWKWLDEGKTAVVSALQTFGMVRALMSAAHDHRTLALGGAHTALFRDAQPWDHAAGVVVIQELGGKVAFLDGKPYSVARHTGPLLATAAAADWEAKARALNLATTQR
jgi:fructose-1,6-bisphosphatase/inositol monophosphatase family enzyme